MKRLALLLWAVAAPVVAATFTVTNTNDSGAGSLRQAILDANGLFGADTIAFNIPGAGVHTITPSTSLPEISETVSIDGYTQPGASANTDPIATNAVILIELDGSTAGGTGLHVGHIADSVIRGLAIGNWAAVGLQATGAGTAVQGCFIGTDASGTAARPNGQGLEPFNGGMDMLIGGTDPADRNLISGNVFGIYLQNGGAVIQGNLIGTDASGEIALPNTDTGIVCATFTPPGATIGGSAPGARNVISGNARGIWISQDNSVNVIQGNLIGVAASGTAPLGNGAGIFTNVGGNDTVIGGVGPGEANVIAHNLSHGVFLTSNGGSENSVRGNAIFGNGGLGIEIGSAGPDFNDPLDADNGPNHQQNFPILTAVEHLGPQGVGGTRIVGKLHSAPSTTFDLDFYSNPACSNFPREFIEGEIYLGSAQVTTDASGNATFDQTFPVTTEAGARISSTATDPGGNTSEFSQRIIFGISPKSGPATGGTPFTVSGTDFADPTTVTVGGVAATGVAFVNDHQLSASTPPFPPGTSQDVVVTTPDGTTGTLIKGWVSDFLDVPQGHLFHDFVVTLVSNGITVGVGGGNYGVDQGTKRQQMAVFLLKSKYGLCYVPPTCTGTFPDVPCPSLFADWIEALADEGITTGCGGGLFCPNNLVTRRQMAVFLLKSKYGSSYLPPACTGVFDDVPCPGAPAVDFIEQLAAEQITGGCSVSPPLYCPDNSSTRGQMAVFITKTFNLQ